MTLAGGGGHCVSVCVWGSRGATYHGEGCVAVDGTDRVIDTERAVSAEHHRPAAAAAARPRRGHLGPPTTHGQQQGLISGPLAGPGLHHHSEVGVNSCLNIENIALET